MLEDVFVDPAAVQRQRFCVLGVYIDAFCARLAELGYGGATIRHKLCIVSGLARWMADELVEIGDLDERSVVRFVEARRRRDRTCRGFERTALQFIARQHDGQPLGLFRADDVGEPWKIHPERIAEEK